MKFSEPEISQLLRAWAAISFAFAIARNVGTLGEPFSADFGQKFVLAGLTVGVAFLIHELAHKYMAQRFNCWAEFRSFDVGLVIAVLMSFSGIIFAAPGAVMISGLVTTEENGKIAAAGPIVNLVLAGLFWLIAWLVPLTGMLGQLVAYGFFINSWLAFFNLIPFGPLDGAKVIRWSQQTWMALLVISGFLSLFVGF